MLSFSSSGQLCSMSVGVRHETFQYLDAHSNGRTTNWPVRMRSMQLTTSSASSILKHIGGLNLITFSQGPSVLTQILSSFNLTNNQKWKSAFGGKKRLKIWWAVVWSEVYTSSPARLLFLWQESSSLCLSPAQLPQTGRHLFKNKDLEG